MSMCCGITWCNKKKEWLLTAPKVSLKNQASSPSDISCSLIKQIASHTYSNIYKFNQWSESTLGRNKHDITKYIFKNSNFQL